MGGSTLPLKGRKKFLADLKEAFRKSYAVENLKVIGVYQCRPIKSNHNLLCLLSALTEGDDDGSIICEIGDDEGNYLTGLSLLIPGMLWRCEWRLHLLNLNP